MRNRMCIDVKILSAMILSLSIFCDAAVGSGIISEGKSHSLKCPVAGESVEIHASKTEQNLFTIKVDIETGETEHPESGGLLWKGDLNADGKTDLILDLGGCGNWGDCEFGVYVACETDNQYVSVWGPEYASGFDVAKTGTIINGVRWADLIRFGRDDDREIKHILSFDGKGYDVSIIDVYEKSMRFYKNNQINAAFDTLDLFFLNHDFRSYHSPSMTDAQYAQILNDYAFLIQRYYQIQAKKICGNISGPKDTSLDNQSNEFLQNRSVILGQSRDILEYVVALQPSRAVAYLNLADVSLEMDLEENAEEFYSEYARLMKLNGKDNLPNRVTDKAARKKYYKCE